MKRVLVVLALFLICNNGLMAQDDTDDVKGVWHDENGVDLPIDSHNQVIQPQEPVVPRDSERQVEPGILDDGAKFNTTVPDGAFGGQRSNINPEENNSWNNSIGVHGKNKETLIRDYEIQGTYYHEATRFLNEGKNSKGIDTLVYFPLNPNGKTVQWKVEMLKMVDDKAVDEKQRAELQSFALRINKKLDDILFTHVLEQLIGTKINEGTLNFDKPDLREKAKRDLIINGLILSHFEGLGLEYTYNNILSYNLLFDEGVVGSYFNKGRDVEAQAYMRTHGGSAYHEDVMKNADEIIKKLGFTFSLYDKGNAKYLCEPIKQGSSESSTKAVPIVTPAQFGVDPLGNPLIPKETAVPNSMTDTIGLPPVSGPPPIPGTPTIPQNYLRTK